jgi:tetratricopeptide (TPR) repeat protein
MKALFLTVLSAVALRAAAPAVTAYEGTLTIPTYEHSGREMEPPLFANSTVTGLYPFTTYLMPFRPDSPQPHTYRAIFLENEYLKLTYLPEFGGRIYSVYDKLRGREVFYRNDVVKPAHYNPRLSWPQSGVELTGPHDLHMLTLHGEPFWSNRVVPHTDGSVTLVLGEIDPVYQMKVNLSATLHPGVAALEISVACYNTREGRMPQMFWMNAALPATEKSRFIYPMTRTVGHTTADIADWPLYNGIDYSWDRNNQHMLGVFGIDIYDNFQGVYQFDRDYGVFRYADRRVVQGMKLWTFGNGPAAKNLEAGYTDKAGPYIEVQSGRHVWDGHYEWVEPHKVESWSEWWVPVSATGGLTTLTRDVALALDAKDGPVSVRLAVTRKLTGAKLAVASEAGEIGSAVVDLDPARPFAKVFPNARSLRALRVTVTDAAGGAVLDYLRPDTDPGRKEYTPFTRPLEQPKKAPEAMSVEELVLAAEFKQKELDRAGAAALFAQVLAKDPGNSRAHLDLGIDEFNRRRYAPAAAHLEQTLARDPYADEAYYYLAMAQFALGRGREAERNLYYIWPASPHYSAREVHLGRLALGAHDLAGAVAHLERAVTANGYDLVARETLALALREQGAGERAAQVLAEIEQMDPTNRVVFAERWLGTGDSAARAELLRLLGGQSQEAIGAAAFYRRLGRAKEAVQLLELVERENHDPWGTPPEFYYTLAYCQRRAGNAAAADASLVKARAAAANIDRFPYREESEEPLAEAVRLDPRDRVARFALACLLYSSERPKEAIEQWQAAVEASPADFSSRRALGLALAEQGAPVEQAAAQLERAIELKPEHVATLNDLSALYARAGRFERQLAVLEKALRLSPADDRLAEGVIAAYLATGQYDDAERLVATHRFAPRHRTYGLRDKYRVLRYGVAARAFARGDYAEALKRFQSALTPPVSLGMDDFSTQSSPRVQYYLGRTLDALGRGAEARQAYEKAVTGVPQLSGDRDSWNSENFFILLALDRLGRQAEADALVKRFENFASGERDSNISERSGEARYLLALAAKRAGRTEEARALIESALQAQPDLLAARLELRGDTLDALAPAKGR